MSGKYREILKGDTAPKTALEALKRKTATLERRVKESEEREKSRAEAEANAAAAREANPWDTFVTRDELRHAVETGELPDSWLEEKAGTPDGDGGDGD